MQKPQLIKETVEPDPMTTALRTPPRGEFAPNPGLNFQEETPESEAGWGALFSIGPRPLIKNGYTGKVRWELSGSCSVFAWSGGPPRHQMFIREFIPDRKPDKTTGKLVDVRRFLPSTLPDGRLGPNGGYIECHEIHEGFHLDPDHFTDAEAKLIWDACAAAATRDRLSWLADQAYWKIENERQRQAHLARENPASALAAGISAGIAEALQALGVVPKGGKS
jgi:hypothetical protein